MRGFTEKSKRMKRQKQKHLTASELAFLIEHYPDTPNAVLAEQMGVSLWTIKSRVTKHRLRKSPEYISRQRSELAVKYDNGAHLNTPESRRKREQTMKERYGNDVLRVRWGLDPVSKNRHYRTEPRERLLQRNRLQRLGYIVDQETLTAYYTETTHRAPRLEKLKRGVKKGKMKSYYDFKPLSEKK